MLCTEMPTPIADGRELRPYGEVCAGGTQRTAIALLKMETEGICDGVEHAR